MTLQSDPHLVHNHFFNTFVSPDYKMWAMQQYLTYLCTDINETGLSLVIFLGVEQFYMVRFFLSGMLLLKPKGNGDCKNLIHFSSVSCLFIFFTLENEFWSYIIFPTGWIKILLGEWSLFLKWQ